MKTPKKLYLSLLLIVVVIFAMAAPSFAADTTGHKVSGVFEIDNEAPKDPFTFSLYKVGHFGQKGDKATLELDFDVPADAGLNLDIEKPATEEEQEDWMQAWIDQAKIVATYLPEDAKKACEDVQTDENGRFKFAEEVENGLYLLVSNTKYKPTEKDENGNEVIWTALPMLVMVLNEDVDLTVKPLKETVPPKYMVVKSWNDSGNEKVRPKEIKVEIYYDYKTGEKNEPVETVTLNASNNWCYTWSIENEKYADKTGDKYTVKEVITSDISKAYTVSQSENTNKETNTKTFNITNTYKKTDNPSSNPKVKTGDQGGMWKYYLLGAAALIVLIAVFVRLRSKKDSSQD